MRKYSYKRKCFSVSMVSLCLLSGLVFPDYIALKEADCFSFNPTFENQDVPTLSNQDKSKPHLMHSTPAFLILPLILLSELPFSWPPSLLTKRLAAIFAVSHTGGVHFKVHQSRQV
jgi:hypothetical protein